MLRFFRRIRRKLLDEASLKKYFAYAIGEILLVVIGILLALQINTWNETQKSRKDSFQTLKELKTDLQLTINRWQSNKQGCEMNLFHIERIMDYMHPDSSYSIVLDTSFFWMDKYGVSFIPRNNYEVLKAKRFQFVTDDSLRSEITNFYEEGYYIIKDDVEHSLRYFQINLMGPYAKKNLRDLTFGTTRPNNYNHLKNDDEFLNIISGLRTSRQYAIQTYVYAINRTENLIQWIDKALEDW